MSKKDLVSLYNNPNVDGSLGGVARFAEAQGIPVQEAKRFYQISTGTSKDNHPNAPCHHHWLHSLHSESEKRQLLQIFQR